VIKPYGILISFSILLCISIAKTLLKNETSAKYKGNEDTLWGLSFWTIIGGVAGARVYHVLSMLPYYTQNPIQVLAIWHGGLGIWGAIAGGIISAVVYLRKNKESTLYWLDLMSVVFPLGQAIGRWGNYFNSEILGTPTTLPWGLYVPIYNRPREYASFTKFHPLFLYESILSIILFFLLYTLYRKYRHIIPLGVFLFIYLGCYSTIRFFLEYLRVYSWKIDSLNVSQCVSILVLSLSIIFTKHLSTKIKQEGENTR